MECTLKPYKLWVVTETYLDVGSLLIDQHLLPYPKAKNFTFS